MRRGGTWKEIGLTQRENDGKNRGERRCWITQEEDCLFSTGLSSTFTYHDESALRESEVMPVYLSSSQKAGKEYRRQRGNVICWSKRWLPSGLFDRKAERQTQSWRTIGQNRTKTLLTLTLLTAVLTYQDLFSLQDVLLWQLGGRASSIHCVTNQIRIHWHYTSTKIITPIITNFEISTRSCSTRFIVTLLRQRETSETNNRKFTFDVITFVFTELLHWN